MKSVLESIISRLNRAKEGITELEDRSSETSQAEMQRGKKWKTFHKTSNGYKTISKGITYKIEIPEREKKENRAEEIV